MVKKCWVCLDQITEKNKTLEHIIINACGGKLKSRKIICSKCIDLSDNCDAELAKELNTYSTLFNIKRDRGNPQPIKYGTDPKGKKYDILPGKVGKPILSNISFNQEKNDDGSETIRIVARNEKELVKVLEGLKRKYPNFNVEEAKKYFQRSKKYLTEPIKIDHKLGGELVFRAICKAAINYYVYSGGDRGNIEHLVPFIKGETYVDCVFHYYPENQPYKRDSEEVSHLIYLKASSKEKLLVCYLEYFNANSYLVVLNENYLGEDIEKKYIFDILTQVEISGKNIIIDLSNIDSVTLKQYPVNVRTIERKHSEILKVAQKIQDQNKVEEIVENVFDKVFEGREGDSISKEDIKLFNEEIMKEITPWFVAKLNIKK